jgi:hypothetical protein
MTGTSFSTKKNSQHNSVVLDHVKKSFVVCTVATRMKDLHTTDVSMVDSNPSMHE